MIVLYAFTTLLYCLAVAIIDDPNGARENSNVQQFGDYVNYDTDDDTLNTPEFDYNFWVANDYELYHELISYYKSRGHDCPCDYDNETFTADCAFKELIYKVPDCVPNVTRILNLEDNKLHYRPGFFDRFIDLRELNLRWNEFLESFREVKITGFPKLRRLDLSFCSIYYLDASRFIGLVNLRTLVLEGNYISTISKDSFSETPKLTHLDLSYNVITSIDSYTFSELPNLTNLDLSYNPDPYQSELPFSFTRNAFAGLLTLKNLSLEGVHVANSSSFPVDLFRPLRTLEELNLFRFCRYRQIGDYNYCLNLHKHLSNLPLLRRLNLDVDWLIHLGPGFKSLVNLQEISFLVASDVEFESISNKTFENLRFSPLSMMSLISDSENPSDVAINNVMPYTFASLTHLQELDFSFLSDNCNTAFENFAIGLDKTLIRRLRFSIQCYSDDVLYSGINLAKDILNTQLEYLDLSHGPIAFMDNWIMEMHNYMMGRGDFFSNLPKSLKYLYLQYNHLRRVDFKNLQTLGELLVLNMSCDPNHHNLRQLRHKRNADGTDQSHSGAYSTDQSQSGAYGTDQSQSRTDSTDQSRSRTDSKDQSQSGTDTIEMEQPMDLATDTSDKDAENNENELLQSEDKCYALPFYLHTIDVSYSFLFDDTVDTLCIPENSLRNLNLSNAATRQSNIGRFWKRLNNLRMLEDLNLNGNDIDYIPMGAFSTVHSLKRLSVSQNPIMTIGFEIKTLVNLQMLDISRNEIRQLPARFTNEIDAIAEMQQNFTLYIHGNAFDCDCHNLQFMEWLRDTNAIDRNIELTCRYTNGSVIFLLDRSIAKYNADGSIVTTDLISKTRDLVSNTCVDSAPLPTSESPTSSPSTLIVSSIIGVFILALAVTIVFLVLKLRRKTNATAREEMTLS